MVVLFDFTALYTNDYNIFGAFIATMVSNGLPLITMTYLLSMTMTSPGNGMLAILIIMLTISFIC